VTDLDANRLMKDGLGLPAIKRIAKSLAQVVPGFDASSFQKNAARGLDALELKARVYHLIDVLHVHYDLPFKKLSKYLRQLPEVWDQGSLNDNKAAFAAWPVIDYVAVHGLQHPQEALQTLEKLTPLFSAEFAIRPFLQQHMELTYRQLLVWCEHPSEHVRRLASEGSRSRLPWGMRLPQYISDPQPLAAILNKLKCDESLYVRRSVANNLNDISKDNPDWVIALCRQWSAEKNSYTDWIIKHGLRSLIKAGDQRVFPLLGYSAQPNVVVSEFKLNNQRIAAGGDITFSCAIVATDKQQKLVVDYVVYFMKANGKLAPKVFKLKNIHLAVHERYAITKKHSFKAISTRRYYAGIHQIAIHVNGKEMVREDFFVEG
jgi:3-methyladenine DNA glycosylase AlkC